jgi:hypothetical protein
MESYTKQRAEAARDVETFAKERLNIARNLDA